MNTLRPYVTAYLRHRRAMRDMAPISIADAAYTLNAFADCFGDRPMTHLKRRAVERWFATIGHLAPATQRIYLSRVRRFCDWLVEEGVITANPVVGITVRQPRTVPVTLTREEVARLLAVAPNRRAKAIIWLEVGLGLRACEVARLTVGDYDRRSRTILVRGKGGHERILPVITEVAAALDSYLAETGCKAGPLIRSEIRPWAGVEARTLSSYMRRWMYEAGIKQRAYDGKSGHALRRTAASDTLDVCGDITIVQEMLGHSDVRVTMRHYLRRKNLEQLRAAMEGRDYGHPAGQQAA